MERNGGETNSNNTVNKRTRRGTLAAIGTTGLGILGSSSIVGAIERQKADQIYQNAVELRKKGVGKRRFKKYLLNRGFEISQQNQEIYTFPKDTQGPTKITGASSGETTPQDFEKNDFSLSSTVFTSSDGNKAYASADWSARRDHDGPLDGGDLGVVPEDEVGIGWEHSDYDIDWRSWYSDDHSSKRIANGHGVAFDFRDVKEQDDEAIDGDNVTVSGFAGVTLKTENGTNPSERSIIVSYYHTWFGGTVTGVSFDASGSMSVGVGIRAKVWGSPAQSYSSE